MAEYTIRNFEQNLETILKANNLLIYGDERFFFDKILQKLEKRIFAEPGERQLNYHLFCGVENDISEVLSACMSFPMLASYKMVVVKEFDRLRIDDEESVLKYLRNPQSTTKLVLTADKLEKNKFYKQLQSHVVSIRCKQLQNGEVYSWVMRRLQQADIKADKESIAFLIENTGQNLLRLSLEIEKIINYLGSDKVLNLDSVSTITGYSRDVNIFNFQKSLGTRQMKTSLQIGLQLLEHGNALAAILPMVFTYFRRIWLVKQLSAKQKNQRQIIKELHGSEYGYRDVFAGFQNFSYTHLMYIFDQILEAEVISKSSQKDHISILTTLCYDICEGKK